MVEENPTEKLSISLSGCADGALPVRAFETIDRIHELIDACPLLGCPMDVNFGNSGAEPLIYHQEELFRVETFPIQCGVSTAVPFRGVFAAFDYRQNQRGR